MKLFVRIGILGILFLLTACKKHVSQENIVNIQQQDSIDFEFPITLKYAQGFQVINHKDYKEIHVFNPAGKDTLATYITALRTTQLPDSIKNKGIYIPVPCSTIACLSTTDVGALELLDLREHLIGSGSPEYIWDERLSQKRDNGELVEIGRGMDFNIEQIVSILPDLLVQNFMNKTDVDGNLSKLGIKIIYSNSWKENSLLARAEWFKLMGLFFSKSQMADSIFNTIEKNYNEIKEVAQTAKTTPKVVYGMDNKGIWYLPQNDTYVTKMFQDANAHFEGAGSGNSSIPTSFEEIYEKYHDADYWVSTSYQIKNMKEFLATNSRYIEFKAAKNKNIFLANKREKDTGGNDYWESGHSRPDILLKDIVSLLHPELFPDYETVYWQQLK